MRLSYILSVFALLIIITSACNEAEKYKVTKDENGKLIAQKISDIAAVEDTEEKLQTIAEFIAVDKGFSVFVDALKAAGLEQMLSKDEVYTVLAPINSAFNSLPEGAVDKLLDSKNKKQLIDILKYHIIPGTIAKEDILIAISEGKGSVPLKTLGGKKLTATLKGGSVFLIDEMGNGGRLITTDVKASNGYINTIDVVMKPKI